MFPKNSQCLFSYITSLRIIHNSGQCNTHSCCKYVLEKLKCPSHLRTFKSINKVLVFKNKQNEKDHKREMWKNVSNKKVSSVNVFFGMMHNDLHKTIR